MQAKGRKKTLRIVSSSAKFVVLSVVVSLRSHPLDTWPGMSDTTIDAILPNMLADDLRMLLIEPIRYLKVRECNTSKVTIANFSRLAKSRFLGELVSARLVSKLPLQQPPKGQRDTVLAGALTVRCGSTSRCSNIRHCPGTLRVRVLEFDWAVCRRSR